MILKDHPNVKTFGFLFISRSIDDYINIKNANAYKNVTALQKTGDILKNSPFFDNMPQKKP